MALMRLEIDHIQPHHRPLGCPHSRFHIHPTRKVLLFWRNQHQNELAFDLHDYHKLFFLTFTKWTSHSTVLATGWINRMWMQLRWLSLFNHKGWTLWWVCVKLLLGRGRDTKLWFAFVDGRVAMVREGVGIEEFVGLEGWFVCGV